MLSRVLCLVALWLLWASPAEAQWTKGFDFRLTSGFVTDTGNNTYWLQSETYPVTRNSVTFGQASGTTVGLNGDNSVDPRLAGTLNSPAFSNPVLQIDLPATGDYIIRIAVGDVAFSRSSMTVVIKDNTTTLATLTGSTNVAEFIDATNVVRTSVSDWIANNASITKTFASTTLNIVLGDFSVSSIAHITIQQVSTGTIRHRAISQ